MPRTPKTLHLEVPKLRSLEHAEEVLKALARALAEDRRITRDDIESLENRVTALEP